MEGSPATLEDALRVLLPALTDVDVATICTGLRRLNAIRIAQDEAGPRPDVEQFGRLVMIHVTETALSDAP